ncbi:MAG: cobalamin-dependent protein [Kiritimatiellae bacterium]|nr:cobalamin-dependent protein [Kiritimatiellia bacterium]
MSLEERYGRFAGAANTEPSFGLVCLAAVAQQAGAKVTVVEASAQNLSPTETAEQVLGSQPHIVGITSTTAGIVAAGELAGRIKDVAPQTRVLVGGCHATALPEQTLREFDAFDLAVVGEGERTLLEVIRDFEAHGDLPNAIDGTAVHDAGAVRLNSPRALIGDLDELPLPAWSLLPDFPRAFRPSPARIRRWPCASVVFTRGCPNRCTFCDRSVFGNRCRGYSPAYAVNMVKDLQTKHGVREILIEDDTFVIVPRRIREFCERLLADRVDVSWSCLGRADRVTPDLLALMRKAGCWHISYGIESGDPSMLEAMRKNLDLEQIRQAVSWSREAGLRTKGFFMVGFPNESEGSLRATREFAKALPLDDISVMQLTPFPGSELYANADAFGTFERDWRKMNTLETVFVPHGFTRASLEAARARMLRGFYLRPGVMWRQTTRVLKNPRLIPSMWAGLKALLRNIG